MATTAYLVLQDGSVFKGSSFGSEGVTSGEVVFNTSMYGYQEMLTDPSYAGQIVVPTYPMQGNYGISEEDNESARIQVAGFVVREHELTPSHYNSKRTMHQFLASQGIMGISGVDTRAITRRIRSQGVMMGTITTAETPGEAVERLRATRNYGAVDFVQGVTTDKPYRYAQTSAGPYRIAVVDCGVKYNILRHLSARGCDIQVFPADSPAQDILAMKPDGVVFSPGPGDPVHNMATVEAARAIMKKEVPTLGICLGHQMVGIALGARTFKLKFGHRGGNHPVQDVTTGRVYITSQNHGYAVSEQGLPKNVVVSHRNLNDNTVEGLRHLETPVLTIQYHSEASPGPKDNEYIFDEFIDLIKKAKG